MKPHVICHLLSPVDGRVKVEGWAASSGHSLDELVAEYDRVHETLGGDAWLVGRTTGEEFATGEPHPPGNAGKVERPVQVAVPSADEYAVALDANGRLHWTSPDVDGAPVIVLLGSKVDDAHLTELAADGISYVVADGPEIDLTAALSTLAERFGIKRLLLEGGAHTNGSFFAAGLVDQLSIVLFPAIGGETGSASIIEGGDAGLADTTRLALASVEKGKLGSVHLLYDVTYPR
ncbi:RibD family protein [Sphingomonas sp. CCH5-D11]|uniref:RibD family protein n=1 Tax=Sphingomonas sp. CCH5-D11 TaxID=1768786 RepID=UPI00082C4232|nr:RibD family protein [Sphingomonas sp. CCH5-D11]